MARGGDALAAGTSRVPGPGAGVVLVAGAVAGALGSLLLGQDVNWDLQNYHVYGPHALLHGRHDVDLAAAGLLQTHLNPLVHVPGYLLDRHTGPLAAAALIGALHGANLALVWALARRLLPPLRLSRHADGGRWVSRLPWIGATLVGATAPLFVSMIGTSFAANLLGPLILGAILLLVRGLERLALDPAAPGLGPVLLAGGLLGAATGLKLTQAAFSPRRFAASASVSSRRAQIITRPPHFTISSAQP